MTDIHSGFDETATAVKNGTDRRRRRLLLIALGITVTVGGAGWALYAQLQGGRFVSTDNAYTAAETAQVTPAISGIVRNVAVNDTQRVEKGDVVVVIDDVDAKLALAEAESELGRAIRRVRGYVANDNSLAAQIAARDSEERRAAAQLSSAESDVERAKIDLARREALSVSGSVSGDEVTRARNAFETARAALAAARASAAQARANRAAAVGSREANAALIRDTTEDDNPEVGLARAKRDQARVDLDRTLVRAPVSGIVVRRSVQVGQRIQAGAQLLSVVPMAEMHVDANFKEGQLEHVKIGQSVELTSDLYGSRAKYRGVVDGLSGGTGSAFATIPAQNATGNWIKVVQRLPVRIRLDPVELAARPLQVGLSMTVKIDTRPVAASSDAGRAVLTRATSTRLSAAR